MWNVLNVEPFYFAEHIYYFFVLNY